MSPREDLKLLLESSQERLLSHVYALFKNPKIKAALKREQGCKPETPEDDDSSRHVA